MMVGFGIVVDDEGGGRERRRPGAGRGARARNDDGGAFRVAGRRPPADHACARLTYNKLL